MFEWLCFLNMWVMIFAVGLLYMAMLPHVAKEQILKRFFSAMIVGITTWLLIGYPLAFNDGNGFIGYWSLGWLKLFTESIINPSMIKEMFVQLCFCLYAITMLIGGIIDRCRIRDLCFIITIWIVGCYAPLAHMIWTKEGWLAQLGVIDYSGALVVHLSAGFVAYLFAWLFSPPSEDAREIPKDYPWQFISSILIAFGWFAFNMAPAKGFNNEAMLALLNSMISIVIGVIVMGIVGYFSHRRIQLSDLCDGMICGLVTSTSAVGIVSPFKVMVICGVSCLTINWSQRHLLSRISIYDSVDYFSMNGIGGAMSALVCGLMFSGQQVERQLVGIVVTIALGSFIFGLLKCFVRYLENHLNQESIYDTLLSAERPYGKGGDVNRVRSGTKQL